MFKDEKTQLTIIDTVMVNLYRVSLSSQNYTYIERVRTFFMCENIFGVVATTTRVVYNPY